MAHTTMARTQDPDGRMPSCPGARGTRSVRPSSSVGGRTRSMHGSVVQVAAFDEYVVSGEEQVGGGISKGNRAQLERDPHANAR